MDKKLTEEQCMELYLKATGKFNDYEGFRSCMENNDYI